MSTFRNERVLAAAPAAVFEAFRDPVRLARWWGPEGFTNTFSTFEFQPGGKWLFTMHGPDGKDYPNECLFQEIKENARLRIDHVCEPFFVLEIALRPEGEGTRLEWLQIFKNEAFAQSMADFLKTANEQNLDRLEAELAAKPTPVRLTVEVLVKAPVERVWEAWTSPADIVQWNFASPDWHCPHAHVDLRVGGVYGARMEAKDGSFGFDFGAEITGLEPCAFLQYELGDERKVDVRFSKQADGVLVSESFDAEDVNAAEMQRQGWQAILDNFRLHVEAGIQA